MFVLRIIEFSPLLSCYEYVFSDFVVIFGMYRIEKESQGSYMTYKFR
jgi:hypothetical protein